MFRPIRSARRRDELARPPQRGCWPISLTCVLTLLLPAAPATVTAQVPPAPVRASNQVAPPRAPQAKARAAVANPAEAAGAKVRKRGGVDGWKRVMGQNALANSVSERDRAMVRESLVHPYQMGDWSTLLGNVRKRLIRRPYSEVRAISQFLTSAGGASLEEMVTRAHVNLHRGGESQLANLTPLESVLMSGRLQDRLDRKFRAFANTKLMQDPFKDPRDFKEYRDLVWDRHVQNNELKNAAQLAQIGARVKQAGLRQARGRTLSPELSKALTAASFDDDAQRVKQLRREMDERTLEVRVNRVRYAHTVLTDEAAGVTDRFLAAYVIGVDSDSLVKTLQDGRGTFKREKLHGDLALQMQRTLQEGQQAAGDLVEKSRLLFSGLHWWRRGRYGMGTEEFGLFKSAAAVRDPKLRLALMMPKTAPIPTDPSKPQQRPLPQYQRRHLFFWAYEDRRFVTQLSRRSYALASKFEKSPLVNKHFDGDIDGKFW